MVICVPLHICLKAESIAQVAETSDLNSDRIAPIDCFSKHDPQLHDIAMMLLAELQSGALMGRLYVESLTQVLVVHLLRHYSTLTQTITSQNRSLTHIQVQQAIALWY